MPSPSPAETADILERVLSVRRRALAEATRTTPAALEVAAALGRHLKRAVDG